MSTQRPPPTTGLELVVTRVLHAPRDVVWDAWTDLRRAREWWGPKGFTTAELPLAMRPGGAWRAVMHASAEQMYPTHGIVREIIPPERLAFSLFWNDGRPATEMDATVSFVARGPATLMTFRKGPFPTAAWHRAEEVGWSAAFERLRALIESGRAGRDSDESELKAP